MKKIFRMFLVCIMCLACMPLMNVQADTELPIVTYKIRFDQESYEAYAGDNISFYVIANYDIPSMTHTFESSDPSAAVIEKSGTIRALKPGIAVLTVHDTLGNSAKCTVKVLFKDVPFEGKYYSAPVYWAVGDQIANGCRNAQGVFTEFRPQASCTREAVVTFLWRLAGKPEPKSMKSPFSDVNDSSKYYYKAVLWAAEQKITGGYKDGTFRPDETCLREHVVTFLYRYAGKPQITVNNPFNDIDSSDYYYNASVWANENGIAKGYSSGEYSGGFGPKLDCLREHVVTFLYRCNQKFPQK